jgi:hypothetical protein
MYILSSGNLLIVQDGSSSSQTLKSLVTKVEGYLSKYIRIFVMQGYREQQFAKLKYSDIEVPVSSDLDSLVRIVQGYLDSSVTFSVANGQTTFDCTGYFKVNDNVYAIVNGVRQSWNVSHAGDIVIVANAQEGDEVIIVQP